MLDSRPPLPPEQLVAVRSALSRAGVRLEVEPPAYSSSWRRTGAQEALESQPALDPYAPSPRKTRGATRA